MNRILVVCEGNICRSPMAHGLLKTALPHAEVRSAGLNAMSGMPPDPAAVRLMRQRGIDIGAHRAVQVTRDQCMRAELVLVMSAEQKARLEGNHPFACGRVFRIGEFSGTDVPDPYGRPEAAFAESLRLIEDGLRDWLQRIQQV